jgi:hypothetical protein
MARKATSPSIKVKGLFDHVNHIREKQDPGYIDGLSDSDLKSWSNYMICRVLSMQPELIEAMNQLQIYSSLKPREFYQLLIAVVPLRKVYVPYIKKTGKKWSKELISLLVKHFQDSEQNIFEYLEIMTTQELRDLVSKFGFTEKEVEKLIGD